MQYYKNSQKEYYFENCIKKIIDAETFHVNHIKNVAEENKTFYLKIYDNLVMQKFNKTSSALRLVTAILRGIKKNINAGDIEKAIKSYLKNEKNLIYISNVSEEYKYQYDTTMYIAMQCFQNISEKINSGPRYVQWINDDERDACVLCEKKFTFCSRRHHCRICGDIFCCADIITTNSTKICSYCKLTSEIDPYEVEAVKE